MKHQHGFGWNADLLPPGDCSARCARRGASACADQSASTAGRKTADQGAQSSASSDKREIPPLVTAAGPDHAVRRHRRHRSLNLNARQSQGQDRPPLQSPRRRRTPYHPIHSRATRNQSPALHDDR